jgi:hypothetical protein
MLAILDELEAWGPLEGDTVYDEWQTSRQEAGANIARNAIVSPGKALWGVLAEAVIPARVATGSTESIIVREENAAHVQDFGHRLFLWRFPDQSPLAINSMIRFDTGPQMRAADGMPTRVPQPPR